MAKQATYGNYVVTVEDNGSVNVTKSGALCDNTNAALKEIAEQIGFAVDPKWNCRQLGPKILKEISGGKASSPKAPAATKQEKAETKSNTSSSSKELEVALARIAELEAENKKLKVELEKANKADKTSEKSKSNDPFDGLMIDMDPGEVSVQTYGYEKYLEYPKDRRKNPIEKERKILKWKSYKVLTPYKIGKSPVTQKQWTEIMDGYNPSHLKGDNYAVTDISLTDIKEFIRRLNKLTGKNYRLPSLAERFWAVYQGAGELMPVILGNVPPILTKQKELEPYMWIAPYEKAPYPLGQKKSLCNGLSDVWNTPEWVTVKDPIHGGFDSSMIIENLEGVQLTYEYFRHTGGSVNLILESEFGKEDDFEQPCLSRSKFMLGSYGLWTPMTENIKFTGFRIALTK